jgi:uncharacterized repeat protein (TIGR03803 family)
MIGREQEMTHDVGWGATSTARWCWRFAVLCLILSATAMASPAQDEQPSTNSLRFTDWSISNGDNPEFVSLVQGTDGNLYGATAFGGANRDGTVFKMTPTGTMTTLYSFCGQTGCTDGQSPYAGLVMGTDGSFYGTTEAGGADVFWGTVFKITSGGTLTTLHSFDATDGGSPFAALIQATNGTFYRTTMYGGADGYGTVFSITSGGTVTALHSFNFTDGAYPPAG